MTDSRKYKKNVKAKCILSNSRKEKRDREGGERKNLTSLDSNSAPDEHGMLSATFRNKQKLLAFTC